MIEIIILIVVLLTLHYVLFLNIIFKGLNKLSDNYSGSMADELISIIIPFRNESENILESLKSIENLNYDKENFEVIYVNDSSTDDSLEKITSAQKSDNIKIISVPLDFLLNAHKKRAVRFGIENAKGRIIFTTDADCIHQPDWLKIMMSCFDDKTGFVSGPVEFYDGRNFWGKMQKTEFAGLVLAGAGLIGSNRPIICNAANIAYRRSAFEEVHGFTDNMNFSSGDDEFLMQKIWKETNYKVKFCPRREALVKTDANKSIGQFYNQRKRWASKGLFYADKLLVLKLILIFFFYFSLIVLPILGIFISAKYLIIFAAEIAVKFFFEYRILKLGVKLLFPDELLKNFLPAEIFQVPYIVIAGISGVLGNFTWKERKVKR